MARKDKSGFTGNGEKKDEVVEPSTEAPSVSSAPSAKLSTTSARKPGKVELSRMDITTIVQNGLQLAETKFGDFFHSQLDTGEYVIVLPKSLGFCLTCECLKPADGLVEGRCSTCRPSTEIVAVTNQIVAVTE